MSHIPQFVYTYVINLLTHTSSKSYFNGMKIRYFQRGYVEYEREYQVLKKSPLCRFVESIFLYDANAFMYCEYSTFLTLTNSIQHQMSSINIHNFT